MPQRPKKSARFGKRFFIFGGGNGIGHDAGADLEISHLFFAYRRPNEDAQLAFAIETEVTERAGVRASSHRLQFIDDFHRPKLWRASDAAAGKTRGKSCEMANVGTQGAFHRRDEMLHLRVAFQPDQFRHLHGAELGNFTQIVPQQIGNH